MCLKLEGMSFNSWSRVDKLSSVSALHQVGLFGLFKLMPRGLDSTVLCKVPLEQYLL